MLNFFADPMIASMKKDCQNLCELRNSLIAEKNKDVVLFFKNTCLSVRLIGDQPTVVRVEEGTRFPVNDCPKRVRTRRGEIATPRSLQSALGIAIASLEKSIRDLEDIRRASEI